MSSPTSPGDIATRVGLDAKELDRPCEESLFPSFANYVHPWRLVFADLLALIDLDDVDLQCHSEQEKRLGCLRTWKARNGAKATVGAVVGSVLRNGSVDNAESMCRCLLPGAIIQNFETLQVPSAVIQSPASPPQSPEKSAQKMGLVLMSTIAVLTLLVLQSYLSDYCIGFASGKVTIIQENVHATVQATGPGSSAGGAVGAIGSSDNCIVKDSDSGGNDCSGSGGGASGQITIIQDNVHATVQATGPGSSAGGAVGAIESSDNCIVKDSDSGGNDCSGSGGGSGGDSGDGTQ